MSDGFFTVRVRYIFKTIDKDSIFEFDGVGRYVIKCKFVKFNIRIISISCNICVKFGERDIGGVWR